MKRIIFCLAIVLSMSSFVQGNNQESSENASEQSSAASADVLTLSGTMGGAACDLYYDFINDTGAFHQYTSAGTATRALVLTLYSGSRLEFDAYMNGKYVSHFSGTFNGRTYKGTVRNTKGGVVNFTMHR